MQNCQTIYLIVLLINQLVKGSCSMHKKCKLSKLPQHQVLIGSLLQKKRFAWVFVSEYGCQSDENVGSLSVLAKQLVNFTDINGELRNRK